MAGVENDQTQLRRKNLTRLVDAINFVALTSLITTLTLAIVKDGNNTIITINPAVGVLVYFLTIVNGSSTWIFLVEFMFMVFAHVLPCDAETLAPILLVSCIFLVIGLVGFFFARILFFWKKQFPGTSDFGFISAEKQLRIMEGLIIFFINGCAGLLRWLILQEVWCTLGFVLVGFLGLLSSFCCVYRLVYKWKEYHKAGAMVSSVASPTRATV